MDELKNKLNDLILGVDIGEYDKLIEDFLKDIEKQGRISETDKTPKQPKKKRNVLSTINDDSVNMERTNGSMGRSLANEISRSSVATDSASKLSLTKKSLEPSLRQTENVDKTPSQSEARPSRAAKGKACANLKEPALNMKMRQESVIKEERLTINTSTANKSSASIHDVQQQSSVEVNTAAETKRKSGSDHEMESAEINRQSGNKKVKVSRNNSSIEIVPQPEIKIEVLSDDEKERMPPPAQPPLKTRKKTTKTSKKIELSESSSSTTIDTIVPPTEIKQEKSDTETSTISSNTRPKRTKGKQVATTSISDKTENSKSKLAATTDDQNTIDGGMPVNNAVKKTSQATKPGDVVTPLNATIESVYEDAISDNAKKPSEIRKSGEPGVKNISVLLTKITASDLNQLQTTGIKLVDNENLNNVTFNMNETRNLNVTQTLNGNATFVTADTNVKSPEDSAANSTYVMPNTNETVVIEKHTDNVSQSSLITEDESDDDIDEGSRKKVEKNVASTVFAAAKKIVKNEIFNPLIQSPVRKKVEAYEQHTAHAMASPAAQGRVQRIKSRVQDLKEGRDVITPVSRIPKAETPGTDPPKPYRYLTPKETSTSVANLNLKKKYNSTSKLPSCSSGGGSSGKSTKSSSSRENSVEDLRRVASALQLATEEKKRKREEKQKQAQQIREAKDREKREMAERVAREKAEKYKKLQQEKEEKARQEYAKKKVLRDNKLQKAALQQNLEEIKKNLQSAKILEQKREEDLLEEIQKKTYAELRERDLLDVARMNAMRDEINRNLSNHVNDKIKPVKKQKQYDFDLLLSGDSTDEEDKQTTKKPPPPTWSLSKVRAPVIREQNYIQWNVVDKLFSVQPMTIDLQEIFPSIDSRYLKRNSSVIWSTPPRYSELPKY